MRFIWFFFHWFQSMQCCGWCWWWMMGLFLNLIDTFTELNKKILDNIHECNGDIKFFQFQSLKWQKNCSAEQIFLLGWADKTLLWGGNEWKMKSEEPENEKSLQKQKTLRDCSRRVSSLKNGGYLLSHGCAVPSARAGLTSLFGMGRGGTPPL